MSFGRKTYDGDLIGRGPRFTERRNTFYSKGKANKHAASKRTAAHAGILEIEETPFNESSDKDRYLITYADVITLLLGLFIILYSISNVNAKKYNQIFSAIGTWFGKSNSVIGSSTGKVIGNSSDSGLIKELRDLVAQNNYSNSVRLEENSRGVTIHILDDILFPSGQADLTNGSATILNKLAVILKKLPNDIRVEGHTDNVPINSEVYPSNWHLSVARALNTAYYLIKNEGLPPEKVSIVGYSSYKPIDTNSTANGRANNRRVDIVIIKSNKKL